MIKVTRDGDLAIFEVQGLHKVWVLKSRLKIPLAHIQGARRDPDAVHGWKGWKAPGTYLPGLIAAGTFHLHGERIFWDVVHAENAIVVDLDDDTYSQLIIEVEHPDATVEFLSAAARSRGA